MRYWLGAVALVAVLAGCGGSTSAQEVRGCVIQPGAQCPGADLSGAQLQDVDLTRSDLTGANLTATNLSGANLTEANLSGALLVSTDLSGADLTRTVLSGATITATNLAGTTRCGTVRTDGSIDDSSCPASDTEPPSTTDTTDSPFAGPELTSFEVGELDCERGADSASVAVSWATTGATAVEIQVDGGTTAGFGPSGSTLVAVSCDGRSHEITLTPFGDSGAGRPQSKTVEP